MKTWLHQFEARHSGEEELMDLPSTPAEAFQEALQDIRWVNRYLGGERSMIQALEALINANSSRTYTVLDVGTGSGDIPMALVNWGRAHGIRFEITAVDVHPVAVDVGKALARDYPEIHVVQGDALQLPYPDGSFDLVISALFMHHLNTPKAVRLLLEMARLCRIGFVISDLERHPVAYLSIWVLGKITGKGAVFQHDAPLSVLRGFTEADLQCLKGLSGLSAMTISRQIPYRFILSWKKTIQET